MENLRTQVNGSSTSEDRLSTILMKLEECIVQELYGIVHVRLRWRLQRLKNDIIVLKNVISKKKVSGLEAAGERNTEELMDFLDSVLDLAGKVDRMVDQILTQSALLPDDEMDESNREMSEIESDVKHLKERAGELKLVIEGGPVVGLEADVQLVMSRLISGAGEPRIVAIVGVEGTGKTHFARNVYESNAVAIHFPCRAWVEYGARGMEPSAVLRDIAEQVIGGGSGQAETDYFLAEQRQTLRTQLRCDKILIVLDGVPTHEAWINLYQVLFVDIDLISSGSRVLITTRSRAILNSAGSDFHIHEKKALSDEEGWDLFKATLHSEIPVELEDLGRSIVKKCMGLPREISMLGDYLSKNDVTHFQWSEVLRRINDIDGRVSLYYALGLDSTAEALSEDSRKCLFCFKLFRKDYDVPARRLLVLWVADLLLPRNEAEKLLQELVIQNMIQVAKLKPNGNIKTCRINYLLWDNFLSSKAEEEEFIHSNVTGTTSGRMSTGMIFRLADHLRSSDKFFSDFHRNPTRAHSSIAQYYSKLVSFLSFDSRDGSIPGAQIGSFLTVGIRKKRLMMLQIIDLEDVYQPKLPDSIGKLVQLRYLGLRNTKTATLPSSIGNLQNLNTLDLKRTRIRSLPISIWKMPQLRHLYLEDKCRCKFVFTKRANYALGSVFKRSTSSLVNILTLSGVYVDEDTPVRKGLDRLINLKKLGLVFRLLLQQGSLSNWIKNLVSLEYLKLISLDVKTTDSPPDLFLETLSSLEKLSTVYLVGRLVNPALVETFPSSLTEITLSFSGLRDDPMRILEKLNNLRILSLLAGSYIGETMVCSAGGFPLLRLLNLWMLEELQEWIVEDGAIKILKEVDIRSCYKLKKLPDGLKHLQHCREVKLIYRPSENVQPPDIELVSISGAEGQLSSINFCGTLKQSIVTGFPSSLAMITLSLSKLAVDPMPILEKLLRLRVLNLLSTSYTGEIIVCSKRGFPQLQTLNLEQLEELKDWIIEEEAMPLLKNVEIKSCKKLNMLPEGFIHLSNCLELKITDMPDEFKQRAIKNPWLDCQTDEEHIPSLVKKSQLVFKTNGSSQRMGIMGYL